MFWKKKLSKLSNITNPWNLENSTFYKWDFEETKNLGNKQTIEMTFSWWTMTICIDSHGVCFVLELWYKE